MSKAFNIILARPESETDYYHTQCFKEVAELLGYGLNDLGFEARFTGQIMDNCINVILGYHALAGRRLPPSHNFIIYQLEELSDEIIKLDEMIYTLQSPCIVWDFCESNIRFLRRHGVNALYKPMGFHAKMKRIEHREEKDIDILFYGSLSDRRTHILQQLSKEFKTKTLFGIYGSERDKWIARSKIVLSIYFFKTRYFDDVRLSYLLNNKVFTIVEDTPHKKYQDFMIYAPYDELVETCRHYLENEHLMREHVEHAFTCFSKYREKDFLKNALLMNKEPETVGI